MDTKQLAAFCAVVERRSFSQAADQLGVTQPAVSLQIRSLELVGCLREAAALHNRAKGRELLCVHKDNL